MLLYRENEKAERVLQFSSGRRKDAGHEPGFGGDETVRIAELLERNRLLEQRNTDLVASLGRANARLAWLEASVASALQSVKLALQSAIQILEGVTALLEGENRCAEGHAPPLASPFNAPFPMPSGHQTPHAEEAAADPMEAEEATANLVATAPLEDRIAPEGSAECPGSARLLETAAIPVVSVEGAVRGPAPVRMELIAGPFEAFDSVVSFYRAVKGAPGIQDVVAGGFDQRRLRLDMVCMDRIYPVAALLSYERSNVRLVAFREGKLEVETS